MKSKRSISVDPAQLLVVRLRIGESRKRVIFACSVGYVVATLSATGRRVIAAEIVYDPKKQPPRTPYSCSWYETEIVNPNSIESVSPYDAP